MLCNGIFSCPMHGHADCRMAGREFKENAKYYLRDKKFLFEGWRIFLGVKNFYLRGEEFFRRMQNIIWKTALNGNTTRQLSSFSLQSCNCTEKVQLPAHWSGGSSESALNGHHAIELDVIMQRLKIFWLCGAKKTFDYAKIIARTHRKLEASNDN